MDKEAAIVTAVFLLAAPFASTMAGANADDSATWGLCQAQDNNQQGNESSNGTVSETPPFSNLSEEDCEEAEHPANDTPSPEDPPEERPDDTPGEEDNPGDDSPDEEDNPGDDDDQPDEEDNPGDERP